MNQVAATSRISNKRAETSTTDGVATFHQEDEVDNSKIHGWIPVQI